MGKKKIYTAGDLSGNSKELFDVLNKESALAVVLIGTSFLDNCLASMLNKFFIETSVVKKLLDPSKGSIGNFAARRDLARCLGFIDKITYQDLGYIGDIRNLFAHSHLTMDFNDEEVISKCNLLKYAEPVLRVMSSHTTKKDSEDSNTAELCSPRFRFILTVALLSQQLLVDTLKIKKSKFP